MRQAGPACWGRSPGLGFFYNLRSIALSVWLSHKCVLGKLLIGKEKNRQTRLEPFFLSRSQELTAEFIFAALLGIFQVLCYGIVPHSLPGSIYFALNSLTKSRKIRENHGRLKRKGHYLRYHTILLNLHNSISNRHKCTAPGSFSFNGLIFSTNSSH